jgi:hypothetical protein
MAQKLHHIFNQPEITKWLDLELLANYACTH